MTPDQELLLKIAKLAGKYNPVVRDGKCWITVYEHPDSWPRIEFDFRCCNIEPIWQKYGQQVIEWNYKAAENNRDKSIVFKWLKRITTGTAHDKAVALGEWIDATRGK